MATPTQRSNRDIRCIALGNDRSMATIRNHILRNVATRKDRPTRVYTDGAQFYNFLSNDDYEHRVVVHARGFRRGTETTNNIESLWSELKRIGSFDSGWNFNTIAEVQKAIDLVAWRYSIKDEEDQGYFQLTRILSQQYESNPQNKIINY